MIYRALGVVALSSLLHPMIVEGYAEQEYLQVEATAYCDVGITADGSLTRDGIIAGKREWLGKVAVIYEIRDDGMPEYLGTFEFRDTGGDRRIKDGRCIDIWMPTQEECFQWGRRNVLIQIFDGKG